MVGTRLEYKVAVITGGGSGIGRTCSETFAGEGAKVAVLDIDWPGGDGTVQNINNSGGEALFVKTDVSNSKDVRNAIKQVTDKYGRIDILLNNAGIQIGLRRVEDIDEQDWDRLMNVNLKGVFLCCKYVIPSMTESGKGGSIVNIASQLGLVGLDNHSAYCATKGGVINFTRAVAADCAPYHIRVNCICPGSIDTPLTRGSFRSEDEVRSHMAKHMLNRQGTTQEVAASALYLASDESSFTTGSALVIDGGYTSW